MGPSPTRRTARDLRRANRIDVLRQLYFGGPTSRLEIARRTGLSAATVTNVVADLIADGVAQEAGQLMSEGGRPAVLVRVDPAHRAVVGVDVGETAVKAEVFDLTLNALATAELPLGGGDLSPGRLVALVGRAVRQAREQAGVEIGEVIGAGVGVPGTVEMDGAGMGGADGRRDGFVHAPSVGWERVRLSGLLAAELGMDVLVDNGAKTMGRAEAWFGAGRGVRHLVVALIGTGVGAAVVTDGEVYRGAGNAAGEWGHTTVVIDGAPCRCGATGCLEAYVGAPGILARWAIASGRDRDWSDERRGIEEFAAAVGRGEHAAVAVMDDTARYLGVATANLINLFDPEKIVIGGWAGLVLEPYLMGPTIEETRRHALAPAARRVSFERCGLGPDAVALGAATLIVERFLASGGAPSN
ncbi:sugar kinase [Planotetraspora thailandica]|uniref:Sugar kinase n=1 Tax=Planotetraspora thailandica TaxID=487172 RepID=A0A8J3Y0M5_9ACTN|nr:ROK family transcriptional regulator [Planotetraspora thailandica]GII58629.1 sugar kinase [Planotetraspora thailandica]